MDLENSPLGEKIGPLPVYAYIAVGVVGVLVWHKYHANIQAANATDATAPADDPSLDNVTTDSGTVSVPGQFSPGTDNSGANINTNTEWGIAAANYLTSLGLSPSAVQAAIEKYLNSTAVTAVEKGYIETALQHLGTPPEGTLPLVIAPTPTAAPVKKPGPQGSAPTPPKPAQHVKGSTTGIVQPKARTQKTATAKAPWPADIPPKKPYERHWNHYRWVYTW